MASFTKIKANNKQGYKWICTVDGLPNPVTGKRNQIARRGDTKKQAEERVQKVVDAQKNHGIDTKKIKKLTFEQVAWDWLKTYSKSKVKKNTVRVREKEIKILLRYIAKVIIDKVTHKQYQNILNDLDDKEYARTTIEGVHVTANMIMKYAIKNKMRLDNPCSGAVIPAKLLTVEEIENSPIEDGYLEKHELAEFLNAVNEHGLPDDIEIFHLLAFSGMRSGELCALKDTDFNFELNELRITKTLYNPDNNMRKYTLTPPKSTGSIRKFNIIDNVMSLLQRHIVKQQALRLEYKKLFDDYHENNFVFAHKNGYPLIQKNILIRMERILKKTSIKKKATPHIFRHTHISMLTEAEVDLKTIMKRVGHDDAKTTLKVYTHVTEKMKKNANEKIKNHFADILQI
ncbi:site-specific integrase [Paenibacillus sp. P2(2022)]|uniref:tyrosine-type recombinase/integrase n=1 Tax=Paenibacillus TaxID=44249 RepID=UPI001C9E0889|nr:MULTISPECIES: site-specific integrase [Paenibacillus]MBY7736764.1 site-specific integrase [Paenibacillus polymyxa]MDG0053415.1 site-specific integrase [Paenibacillus sp. P2(2022)]